LVIVLAHIVLLMVRGCRACAGRLWIISVRARVCAWGSPHRAACCSLMRGLFVRLGLRCSRVGELKFLRSR